MKSKRRPVIELALDVDRLADAIVAKLKPLLGKPAKASEPIENRSWLLSEWAKLRGVSKSFAQREIYAGRLKAKRVQGRGSVRGGSWLVTPEADQEWLANLPSGKIKQQVNGARDEDHAAP